MRRSFARLLTIALVMLACGCARKDRSAGQSRPRHLKQTKSDERLVQAATPEDPGPGATVVVPLQALKGKGGTSQVEPDAETAAEMVSVDHPVDLPSEKPRNFLHTVFSVNKYSQFTFVVPAHQGHPRLHGEFRSFTRRDASDSTSNTASNVDVMLLNEQEFNEFQHGRLQSALYELDPAHNQRVDWSVPPAYAEPQKYHLVFSNSDAATGTKFVQADFTVSF